jgi:hypothetical protein
VAYLSTVMTGGELKRIRQEFGLSAAEMGRPSVIAARGPTSP